MILIFKNISTQNNAISLETPNWNRKNQLHEQNEAKDALSIIKIWSENLYFLKNYEDKDNKIEMSNRNICHFGNLNWKWVCLK